MATVHLKHVYGEGETKEVHLCENCAAKKKILIKKELNISSIITALLSDQVGGTTNQLANSTCPACGLKYSEFRAEGRLGCPHDYDEFRQGLEPLIARIHRNVRHHGKRPNGLESVREQQREMRDRLRLLLDLRRQLQDAVKIEAYEDAAKIRDRIRDLESLSH